MNQKRVLLINHVKDNAIIYLFMTILFLTGIIFGAIIVNSMNTVQKQDLFFYLERFFGEIVNEQSIDHTTVLKQSFFYHTKYLVLLFILGLSVVGLPIIWILLYIKGLVIGFTVGFIVSQLGFKGLLLATLSIAPQNILIIPIYIIAGTLAMIFSLTLLNKLFSRHNSQTIFQPFSRYMVMFTLLILISFGAALVEAFVSNAAMESLIKSFY